MTDADPRRNQNRKTQSAIASQGVTIASNTAEKTIAPRSLSSTTTVQNGAQLIAPKNFRTYRNDKLEENLAQIAGTKQLVIDKNSPGTLKYLKFSEIT